MKANGSYYPALSCGCRPYFEAHTYDGWRQFGRYVKRGEKAKRVERSRDRLFCLCQTTENGAQTLPAAAVKPEAMVDTPAGPVRLSQLELKAPPEAEVEAMSEAEVAFFEAAEGVKAEAERAGFWSRFWGRLGCRQRQGYLRLRSGARRWRSGCGSWRKRSYEGSAFRQ